MNLMAGLLLVALAQQPVAPSQAVAAFTRLEQQWMDALAAKDEAVLERMLAQEFSIVGAGSQPDDLVGDRASWLRLAMSRPFPKHQISNVRVTVAGSVAVVQCVLTADYPARSLTAEAGTFHFLTTDVWVERDGRWQVLTRHSSLPRPPVVR